MRTGNAFGGKRSWWRGEELEAVATGRQKEEEKSERGRERRLLGPYSKVEQALDLDLDQPFALLLLLLLLQLLLLLLLLL